MFDKEYVFYGKHADMVKRLTGSISDPIGRGLFKTNIEVYCIAPYIGYLYNVKGQVVKDSDSNKNTKIFRDKMMDSAKELQFNYRNLMMHIFKDKPKEERMRIAFRLDDKDEERKKYDELYNSYVLGGVEKLYSKIFDDANNEDEYLMNLYDFLEEFYERYYTMNE